MSDRPEPGATHRTAALDATLLHAWPMPVRVGGDKFSRGTALVIGGSDRTPGSMRLAGEAALRMGAGRLQLATAASVATALAVALPESMVVPLPVDGEGGLLWPDDDGLGAALQRADAVLVGPGMMGECTTPLVVDILRRVADHAMVVLDAVAIQSLAGIPDELVPRGRLLLTPNRQELRTLTHRDDEDDERDAESASAVARRYGAVVSCFGRVTTAEQCWDMGLSSPGLGTSGSGDVLAGLAAGAAARCGDRDQAACWATFVHARSATRLALRVGELSFLARELVAEVPAVLADAGE